MRINKFIAHYTPYSRREADTLIEAGRIKLNGHIVKEPGVLVGPNDRLSLDDKLVKPTSELTVIVYHKPKGELVTKRDPKGRPTIYHSLPKKFHHFIPIGRLDFASEGVLLMTDAPRVAEALMNSQMERVYNLKLQGRITPAMEKAMQQGMRLEDARAGGHAKSSVTSMEFTPFFAYQILKNGPAYSRIRVAIGEGKNRELRRFFAHFGTQVLDLHRISFGGVSLNNLPKGKTRYLSKNEYDHLHQFLKGKQT